MNLLVVIGHQNPGSFCHAIAESAVEQLESDGHEVVFHDLYAEGFEWRQDGARDHDSPEVAAERFRSRAAEALGLSRSALYRRLQRYGL